MRTSTVGVAAVLALCGCAHSPARASDVEEGSADSALVAYLDALVDGDCSTAKKLAASTFVRGNGELCGDLTVDDARVTGVAATPNMHEAVFATVLTTSGSRDGSVPAGPVTWYYTLKQQADGGWRLTAGGTGP